MAKPRRAPARARNRAPSSRRYAYTPELLAHGRHRFEHTEDSVPDIAVEFGIHKTTLLRLARREGWVRYAPPPRDVSGATRLLAQVEALAEAHAPEAAAESEPPKPADAPASAGVVIADVESALETVRTELATVKRMRERMKHQPQSPLDAERTARTLSSLTQTMHRLQRMRCGTPEVGLHDDDMPSDIDAFREALAQRIEAFLASRGDEDDAGDGDGGAAVSLG
jgi:hypothetical protein